MSKQRSISRSGVLLIMALIFSGFTAKQATSGTISSDPSSSEKLKAKALIVLQTKCNFCHKRQNPFKVFKEKNMSRYAPKVYEQVFVKKRMPKKGILTQEERKILEEWLKTEKRN